MHVAVKVGQAGRDDSIRLPFREKLINPFLIHIKYGSRKICL